MKLLLFAALAFSAFAADVCNPRNFQGTYGFQLSGDTQISGDTKPTASIGKLVFDGAGGVSGYSSAHFAGYLQGNPTTGKYEVRTDCSLDWSLQDDSGAYQHFQGKVTPDFARAEFHQTDPGGPQRGIMVRTPEGCSATSLKPQYHFAISGNVIPMEAGQEAHKVSLNGTAQVEDGGKLLVTLSGKPEVTEGTYEIDTDCVVTAGILNLKLRGYLVDGGNQVLAIEIDPGATVTARLTAQ